MAWIAPAGTVKVLDLRGPTQAGIAGPTPHGHGLFMTADATDLGANYLKIEATLTTPRRNAIRNLLGLADEVTATTPRDLIVDFFTKHARVQGDTFCKPLMPGRNGQMRLFAGSEFLLEHQISTGSPYWPKVSEVYQADYRRQRQYVLDGLSADAQHRRWLGGLLKKFPGVDYHIFLPADVPDEPPLPPATTYSDNFNRADGAIGSSSEGWSWANVGSANWTIQSNAAEPTASGRCRISADLSSDDHYAEILGVDPSAGPGVVARLDPSADTCYAYVGDLGRLQKVITGTPTTIDTGTEPASNSVMRVRCDGSTIQGLDDGVVDVEAIDTDITGFTRSGLGGSADSVQDDFVTSDLSTTTKFVLARF